MKKKFLISGLALFAGALVFTFSSNNTNQDDSVLFVDSDNIAQAYFFGGCVSNGFYCDVPDGPVVIQRRWVTNPIENVQ